MSRLALKAALQPAGEPDALLALEPRSLPSGCYDGPLLVSGKALARARLDEAHALGTITDEERERGLRLIQSRPW